MKNKLLGKITLLTAISLLAVKTSAQEADKNVRQKITDENGKPTLILFNDNSTYKTSDYLKTFKEQLNLKDNSKFAKVKLESDQSGYSHENFNYIIRE